MRSLPLTGLEPALISAITPTLALLQSIPAVYYRGKPIVLSALEPNATRAVGFYTGSPIPALRLPYSV